MTASDLTAELLAEAITYDAERAFGLLVEMGTGITERLSTVVEHPRPKLTRTTTPSTRTYEHADLDGVFPSVTSIIGDGLAADMSGPSYWFAALAAVADHDQWVDLDDHAAHLHISRAASRYLYAAAERGTAIHAWLEARMMRADLAEANALVDAADARAWVAGADAWLRSGGRSL